MKTIIILLALVVISGCIQQEKYVPVTEILLEGHGNEVYTFANDIREALKVETNDTEGIKTLTRSSDFMALVFDGSVQEDNAYFTVIVTNLDKVTIYYSYEGRLFRFIPYYYIGDEWFDRTGKNITKPDFNIPVLWLKGPNTGANDTSLMLDGNNIYLSGTNYKNLTLAGDKLALLFFNIDSTDDIEGA